MDPDTEATLADANVVEPKMVIGEYHFRVGELKTPIAVKLYRHPGDKRVFFMLSHFIHTPSQPPPRRPSVECADTEALALDLAVTFTMAAQYELAVEEGHKPDESWLVPNEDYR